MTQKKHRKRSRPLPRARPLTCQKIAGARLVATRAAVQQKQLDTARAVPSVVHQLADSLLYGGSLITMTQATGSATRATNLTLTAIDELAH